MGRMELACTRAKEPKEPRKNKQSGSGGKKRERCRRPSNGTEAAKKTGILARSSREVAVTARPVMKGTSTEVSDGDAA